jgi:hypothetical protein
MANEQFLNPRGFLETARTDAWWAQPLVAGVGFLAAIVYMTWAAFQGEFYHYGPYLSPLYSPELFGESHHNWFGPKPEWWLSWLPWSPAFLILWGPGGFRVTCYYYRGFYYKSYWADPPNCGVGEPRSGYWGENSFPLIAQNIHRYFLYIALVFNCILTYDAWLALWWEDPVTGQYSFGVGIGFFVLAMNAALLGGYSLSCHSLRHIVGGRHDQLSNKPVQKAMYKFVSWLNARHMMWAWISLGWVCFADIYVRLCAMGIWTDWRLI